MKSVFLSLFALTLTSVYAQKSVSVISLPMDKSIISKNEMIQSLDMGMGMMMNSNISTTTQYNVIGLIGDEYHITRKLTATKMEIDMMGQKQSYDSDLKTDADSEIGKEVGKRLNVLDTFTFNRSTGEAVMISKSKEEADDANPMSGMLKSISGGTQELVIEDIFFPGGHAKKVGDKWVDSLTTKDLSYEKDYTLTSKGKSNEISFVNNTKNKIETETQGMALFITMDTKSEGTMNVDPQTAIVMNKKSNSNINGNFEVMGQTAAITGTTTSNITTEIK